MAVPLAAALACVGTQAVAATTPANVAPYASGSLSISMQVQQNNEWCWAASGATVLAFEGNQVSQNAFCDGARGLPQGYRCPNRPAQISDIMRGLSAQGATSGESYGPMSFSEVAGNIDNRTPFITAIHWSAGGGHAEVGYAYDAANSTVSVGDPWPSDRRYQTWNYRDYVNNSQFRWVDAVEHISPGGGIR